MKRTGNSFESLKSPTLVKKSASKNDHKKVNSALSREDLLDLEKEYFANEQKVMKQRRTKIIATLGDKSCSVELIKELYHAGMNVIRINLAYCDQKSMEIIMKNKAIAEKDLNVFIPVIADLKGTTTRLGVFNDGEVHLKKGDEFRISTNKKIIGDKNIVSCDEEDLGKIVKEGDMILIDYGQISLKVVKIEKESDALAKLREKHALKYAYGFPKKQKGTLKSEPGQESLSGVSEEDLSEKWSNEEDQKDNTLLRSSNSMSESGGDEPKKGGGNSKRSKFNAAFKSGKKKIDKDVLLLEAMNDCLLMSNKALFILKGEKKSGHFEKEVKSEKEGKDHHFDGDDEEDQACITVKDVKDMNYAIKLGVDCIAISGVHSARDINDARFILGKQSQMRIIAKIQDTVGVEKFDEILQAADAIIISRAYLTIHTTVEKLYFKQKEMIKKCHEAGKPVIIVGQLLESMILGLVPSTSEINDISGLILDGVDSLALVSETTFGSHKKEAVETLSRICYEVEYNEVAYNKRAYSQTNMINNLSYINPYANINMQMSKSSSEKNTTSISQAIADCVIKAVYDLGASLIVSFTSTGSTVLKISKRRSPCPIIAVTTSEIVARQVSTLASVTAVKVGSFFGSEGLTPRVIAIAKDKNWVKSGDYIVVTHGDLEGIPGSTNSLKIVKVP